MYELHVLANSFIPIVKTNKMDENMQIVLCESLAINRNSWNTTEILYESSFCICWNYEDMNVQYYLWHHQRDLFFLLSPHINVKVSDEITKNCASDSYKHLIFIYWWSGKKLLNWLIQHSSYSSKVMCHVYNTHVSIQFTVGIALACISRCSCVWCRCKSH